MAAENSAKAAPLIPLRDFFRNPDKVNYSISPSGEYIAFLAPSQNRLNIHVQKIGEEKVVRLTNVTERDIRTYLWVSDTRLVYLLDQGGDENFKLYGIDRDGSNPKALTPFDKVRVEIIDDLRDNPDEILLSMNKRDNRVFDAYRLNVHTGAMTMIAENPGTITGWMADHAEKLRIATSTDGVKSHLLYRASESEPFRTILTTNFRETLEPLQFTFDNSALYVSSNIGRDKQAIFTYDPAKATIKDLLYEHPEVDVSEIILSDKQKKVLGVAYTLEKRQYSFFDPERKKMQDTLEQRLPGYEVAVVAKSRDETRVLVRTYSDRSMGAYYYYNRTSDELKKLVEISPWLPGDDLAEMKPISYRSGDGLTIHGYLTLPKGVAPQNLPIVVNPHGGPWHRDSWGYNPEVQFLANRGYGVLQLNFRGSTGYGRKFWEASFKQWGRKMQDDISDGTRWLIKTGVADPKRIGIYGGSYGGYATLAGLTFSPELYACGVDYVGVANIFSWFKAIPAYWTPYREMLYEMVGDPEKDKELLTAVSPVFHVDKIRAPLFVAQGANDPRVPKSESDQMVEALKKRGIDVPYLVKNNEGHGFRNEENRFDLYRAVEEFLGKQLKGKVAPVTPSTGK